jgi:lysozyme family protein
MVDQFSVCLPLILKEEGGNSDDPNDPGGRTSRGIIQTEYDAYRRSKGDALQSVYDATDAEVSDIYLNQYWLPYSPQMPAGVDLCYFDMAVNGGPVEAAKLLQKALGVAADGHIGLITLGALKAASPIRVISGFSDQRTAFYRGLRTFKYFGKGWLTRVQTIEQAALKMAANAPAV